MIRIEDLQRLGGALKELRWQARLKQVEVCRQTGMTAPQVSRYENGRETPTLESLVKYLHAVGADLGDLQRVLGESREEVLPEPDVAAPKLVAPPDLEGVKTWDELRRRLGTGIRQLLDPSTQPNVEGLDDVAERLRALEKRLEKGGL